jgi:glucose/arabinose dehydrogenase
VANTSGVVRYTYQLGQTEKAGDPEDFITGISSGGYNQHWTRNILFDKDRLFLSIGSESNVDADPLPRASIQVYDLNGKNPQTYAHGLRNPIGLAVHPTTGVLYTAVNERDELGDNLVPDYLTSVQEGGFYGWPYAYLSAINLDPRRMKGGKSERPDLAEKTITPEVLFESHSAALGLAFYTGKQLPEEYRGDAFVAFHGSWNRSKGTGYKVVRISFDQVGKPKGGYEDFLTGWLTEPEIPAAWGRPVGVTMAPDGSLLITDDTGGVVWRVSYTGKK